MNWTRLSEASQQPKGSGFGWMNVQWQIIFGGALNFIGRNILTPAPDSFSETVLEADPLQPPLIIA